MENKIDMFIVSEQQSFLNSSLILNFYKFLINEKLVRSYFLQMFVRLQSCPLFIMDVVDIYVMCNVPF